MFRPMRDPTPRHERGAALLTVLLLVAVMAVVTAIAIEKLTLSTRMARNGIDADQGRALLMAGETVAAFRLADLVAARPGRTTLQGGWLGTAQSIAVPGGTITARVRDAGNCFNLNSLVQQEGEGAALRANAQTILQFAALMRLVGVDTATASQIAVAAADWIDDDAVPGPGGAEDSFYLEQEQPYRTAGGLIADPAELRLVAGVTPAIYDRVRPWLCALPIAEPSPININTLLPEQAILLAMLTEGRLPADQARQVLAQRPRDGYGSLVGFWGQSALAALALPSAVTEQAKLTSRWFEVELRVDLGGNDVSETALFDAETAPARLVCRRWGDEG